MKNIRCYVIDDETDAVALLRDYIESTPGLELCGSAENPLEALDFLTSAQAPDITFVDIDMRQLTGLELAGMVNLYTTVIFTTAFPQYALQAFEKEAFDYLLKPIDRERFLKCIQRVKRKWHRMGSGPAEEKLEYFNIKSEIKGRMVRIRFDEVIFIEGAVNYIQIHTVNGKHMTYLTLKEIMQHLPRKLFTRIHRSFVININYARIIERNQVRLEDGRYLPMGDHYKEQFLKDMDDKLLKSERAS
ncbi:response regulator transcription factor [Mucilaginibacter limnophilus]|uniref:Response regulator transcription factor n=1 Tax=Mucilaginibacter limnophilus TaxID=1932778 RepID=A0A3S2WWM1_9SPHI|nr:LytTR family DNA-binding domain-containing protein [Mucilaginibacter limnophilus]RVT98445.1 response regulator transcription factor [Mucilaginibacter limnophilus]